jgi:tetratricopeptide (TPR) repeat protein
MGILKTLDGSAESSAQERADHLYHALGGMRDDPDAYGVGEVKSWTEFLLTLALLETAEPSNYQPAEDLLPAAIESSIRFPIYLWERLFEAAGMFDDPGLAISTARHLLDERGEASECLLENAPVLAKNQELLTAVLTAFLERRSPVRTVWNQLTSLLPTCLSTEAFEAAEIILDQMDKLARSHSEFRPALIEILRDSDQYSPAWDTSDAEQLLADLLELEGKSEEAAEVLRNQFYLLKNGGQSHELYGARQVLLRLNELGKAGDFGRDLEELLPNEEDSSEIDLTLEGRVLYIGGNETQQRYIDGLKTEIKQDHPDLDVSFHLPGWTSNWNVHLAKLKPMIDEADVVVINSLIRTQLGRHLRVYCSAEHPWLPCTGRGFDSLKRSILGAAAWIAGENL